MRVQLLYRNYKPIHKIYESLVTFPPKGVEFIVPTVNNKVGRFKFLYRKAKHLPLVKLLLRLANNTLFVKKIYSDVDLVHLINVVPGKVNKEASYVLEAEHAGALTNFTNDEAQRKNIVSFIKADQCKAVICTSKACLKTFKLLLGPDYKMTQKKFNVVYPALASIDSQNPKHDFIKKSHKIKLLFVGNDCYRKGLKELLEAMKIIDNKYGDKIELHIISDDATKLVEGYALRNIYLYPANFSKTEIIDNFFLPADVFIMPTKLDTFGMVIIDAISCGTPVVATDQFAIPEMITNKVNGLLLKQSRSLLDENMYRTKKQRRQINSANADAVLVDSIVDALKVLVGNPGLLNSMKKSTKKEFEKSKFTVEHRNRQLLQIYEQAISDKVNK